MTKEGRKKLLAVADAFTSVFYESNSVNVKSVCFSPPFELVISFRYE